MTKISACQRIIPQFNPPCMKRILNGGIPVHYPLTTVLQINSYNEESSLSIKQQSYRCKYSISSVHNECAVLNIKYYKLNYIGKNLL
jgi:hypothetical protein